MKEIKIWLLYTNNSFQQVLSNRATIIIFMTGKILRVALFLGFLFFLLKGTKGIGSYSPNQIIFFYLSFNLIDTLAQLFFREVYRFRPLIVSGSMDLILVKPINPLVRVLLGGADVMDLMMLILLTATVVIFGTTQLSIAPVSWLAYLVLVLNGLIISAAFYIFVLGLGVVTTTVDHLVNIYRDFTSMLRIPVDIYSEPLRFVITYVLPLGIMITFPAKALLGLLSPSLYIISILFGIISIYFALLFWNYSLKKYSSASS